MAPGANATPTFLATRDPDDGLAHDNLGPQFNVAIWVLTGAAALFLALRLYCKFIRRKKLWWDDWVLLASFVRLPPVLYPDVWQFRTRPHPYSLLGFPRRPDFAAIRMRPSRLRHAQLGYQRLAELPVCVEHNRRVLHHCRSLEQDILCNPSPALHRRPDAAPCLVCDCQRQPLPRS